MENKKRLIDANELIKRLQKSHEYHARNFREEVLLYRDIRIINEEPTVDAVVLPCKVGDTVWTIIYNEILEVKVTCIRPFVFEDFIEFRGNVVITMADPFYSDGRPVKQDVFVVFGEDTFLTREEAEAALAERAKGNE